MKSLCASAVMLFVLGAAIASAADPFVGTFTLNVAKSKMSGAAVAAAVTMVISEDADHLLLATSGKNADGSPIATKLAVPKKGGQIRVLEGTPGYDSATATRTSPTTVQVVTMQNGKEGVRVQLALSPDGKVLTRSIKGTNSRGQQVDGVSVLERQ